MSFSHRLEEWMVHSILGCDPLSVVVSEHLAQKVKSFVGNKVLVLSVDEFVPGLAWLGSNKIVVVVVEGQAVLVNIGEQFVGSKDLCNLDELVVVVAALEEGLLLEDHTGEHASK